MASEEKDFGGQAFPIPGLANLPNGNFYHPEPGMTLRQYYAGQAISGVLCLSEDSASALIVVAKEKGVSLHRHIAESALLIADALIKAEKS